MRVIFLAADNDREQAIAAAFKQGVDRFPHDSCKIVTLQGEPQLGIEADAVAMFGVKSAPMFHHYLERGIRVIYIDKGYSRTGDYWRFAVDAHQPIQFVRTANRRAFRALMAGFAFPGWKEAGAGRHVIFVGSSAKNHAFHGLPEPTEYAHRVIARIREATDLPIIYCPKPSWAANNRSDAVPIDGTTFAPQSGALHKHLASAEFLVTHNSSACLDAVLAGVPPILLGPGVTQPISSTRIGKVHRAPPEDVNRLIANVAHCQYTTREMATAHAWEHLRPQL